MTYQTYTLRGTGKPPIRFQGILVASNSTSDDRAYPDYSGSPGISHQIDLYRVSDGTFVVDLYTRTLWQGYDDRRTIVQCRTACEVLEALAGIRTGTVDELLDEANFEYEDYYPVTKSTLEIEK